MIDNKDLDKNLLDVKKSKFTFLGFIIGIVPFIILIGLIGIKQGGIKYISSQFRETLVLAGIITSIINACLLRHMASEKLRTMKKDLEF